MYSYSSILGAFPLPGSATFEPSIRELAAVWLAACPLTRATTYYFSTSGDDSTGDGSEATPWETITKANTVLAAGVRCRFKRGDVWRDSTELVVNGGCVDAYGTGAPPRLTGFLGTIASGGASWTNATGDRWTATINPFIGRIRELDRPFKVYKKAASTAEVEANANSYYYTGTTMHINAGSGVDPNDLDWEHNTAWPSSTTDGIVAGVHGSRIDGIQTDGQGLGLSLAQAWGIKAENTNDTVVCITNCQSYFHSRHNLGLFAGPGANGGKLLVQGCRWGFFDEANGSAVANFANDGGHEVIMLDWECCGGQIPTGLTEPTTGNAFIAHTSGGSNKVGMHVALNGLLTRPYGYGVLKAGSVNDAPGATLLGDVRAVTHGLRWSQRYDPSEAILFASNNAVVNADLRVLPKDNAAQGMHAGSDNGWLIDSQVQIDLTNVAQSVYGVFNNVSSADTAFKMINSHIQWVRGSGFTGTAVINRDTYFSGAGGSAGALMLNSVISGIESLTDDSAWSTGTLYAGGANYAASTNNAFFGVSNAFPSDDRGYGSQTGEVTLSYAPAFGGIIPDPSIAALGAAGNTVPDATGSEATAAGPMPAIEMRGPTLAEYTVMAAAVSAAVTPLLSNLDAAVSSRSTFDPAASTVDVGKISGDAAAADNLEAILDGTGGFIELASAPDQPGLLIRSNVPGEAALEIVHFEDQATAITIKAQGNGADAVTINDGSGKGIFGVNGLAGIGNAAASAVLTTPANKLVTNAAGQVESSNMRGTDNALPASSYVAPDNAGIAAAANSAASADIKLTAPRLAAIDGAAQAGAGGRTLADLATPGDVSSGGAGSGDGDTVVNHNSLGIDELRAADASGNGLDNVTIRAYLTAEFAADATTAPLRATAVTGADGRWVAPMMLNSGLSYTLVFTRPDLNTSTREVTIP